MSTSTFGSWLSQKREALKLTITAAAKRARIHPSTWCDIEHGRRRPSEGAARRMAKALRLETETFFAQARILTAAARELLKKDARVVARLNSQALRRAA